MSSARERILNKLSDNNVEVEQVLNNDNIYLEKDNNLLETFKQELKLVDGEVFVVNSQSELINGINKYLEDNNLDNIYCNQKEIIINDNFNIIKSFDVKIDVAITSCEFLSARTGSVVVSSKHDGRKINIFAPTHIIVANENQIVSDIDKVIEELQKKYEKLPSAISFITGPSRTADIEKTLILGAHGPKKLLVFIIKN